MLKVRPFDGHYVVMYGDIILLHVGSDYKDQEARKEAWEYAISMGLV